MMIAQRLLAAAMAAVLVLSMTGCGQKKDATASVEEDASKAIGADRFVGEWAGALTVSAAMSLPLVLTITENSDGDLAAALDSPAQNTFGIEASNVTVEGEGISIAFSQLGAEFDAKYVEGDAIQLDGNWLQGGQRLPLVLTAVAEGEDAETLATAESATPPELVRPQTPTPPFPYTESEVRINVPGTDVTLAGTLTRPDTDADQGVGVVLLTGSGPQDRDEYIDYTGHRPFLVLSDALVRLGITVLRYDDRGVAESTGDFGSATLNDFANDASAALSFLAEEMAEAPVGFLGHSEGGLTAIIAATEAGAAPDYIISLAGPFVPLGDVIITQTGAMLRASGAADEQVTQSVDVQRRLVEAVRASASPNDACIALAAETADLPEPVRRSAQDLCRPWAYFALSYDPAPAYAQFEGPVLAVFGGIDMQVDSTLNAAVAEGALLHPSSEVVVFDSANHLFQNGTSGSLAEYAQIEETMRPDVMAKMATFILGPGKDAGE